MIFSRHAILQPNGMRGGGTAGGSGPYEFHSTQYTVHSTQYTVELDVFWTSMKEQVPSLNAIAQRFKDTVIDSR